MKKTDRQKALEVLKYARECKVKTSKGKPRLFSWYADTIPHYNNLFYWIYFPHDKFVKICVTKAFEIAYERGMAVPKINI